MLVTTTTAGCISPQTRLKAASSHSITAVRFLGRPVNDALEQRSAAMPRSRLEPERLAMQSILASVSIFSIMRQVVVLPLVPVTMTVRMFLDSRDTMSGHTRSASVPGSAVPPRPITLSAARASLHNKIARNSLIRNSLFCRSRRTAAFSGCRPKPLLRPIRRLSVRLSGPCPRPRRRRLSCSPPPARSIRHRPGRPSAGRRRSGSRICRRQSRQILVHRLGPLQRPTAGKLSVRTPSTS